MDVFKSRVHQWFSVAKRDLPWRSTLNPYYIWLSEIILQQTRIDQGLAYYQKFTETFPTIEMLANATEDQVLKLWQGLGYYSRARNLYFTARYITKEYNGIFPNDYQRIRALKGVGDYTAAAIASISFNQSYPAVDGNVYRVLARFFGISDPIDSTSGKKTFKELACELIKGTDPGMHNQAIMEFGALQCTPQKPDCMICPLRAACYAFSAGKVNDLPVKLKKTKQRDRFFNYFIFADTEYTWLRKRREKDIWKNLYEFPMIETTDATSIESLLSMPETASLFHPEKAIIESVENWKTHLLTHQRINYRAIRLKLTGEILMPPEFERVNKKDIFNFAVPKLLEKYLYRLFYSGE
jgi:A/G-specific adenine glycosylase